MQINKELLKNFSKVAITSGLAIATQGQSTIAGLLINSFGSTLLHNFIGVNEIDKLKKTIRESNPEQLNNNLKKIIIESVELSIQNIRIQYETKLSDKQEIKLLKSFTEDLVEEVKLLYKTFNTKDVSFYNTLQKDVGNEGIFEAFDLNADKFPVINETHSYPVFFKEKFTSTLQVCFGELLKMEVNRPAYITYQREVYQNLDKSIEKIVAQNEQLLQRLIEKDQQVSLVQSNNTWNAINKKVKKVNLNEIDPKFEASFNNQLVALHKKADMLIDITSSIKSELGDVKALTKDISITLNRNWISKNKIWIFTIIAVLSLSLVGIIWLNTRAPFQMNVRISKDASISIHPQYPPLSKEARIRFYLPAETKEKEVTFSNEMILADLQSDLKDYKSKMELLDPYWTVSDDSIKLVNGNLNIEIRPNDALAEIKGRVLSRDGQILIENSKVSIEGLQTMTNQEGIFLMKLPIELRRIQFVLRVEKAGYKTIETEYISGAPTEIRIEKIN